MNQHVKAALFSALILFQINPIEAEPLNLNLTLCNGYRQDRLTCTVNVFDSQSLQLVDKLTVDKISLYELGAKGRFGVCDWRFRGEAFWGWGTSGKYHDKLTEIPTPQSIKASISSASTQDFTIGGGYLFTLGEFLEIIPMGGLSYNCQRIKIRDAKSNHSSDNILNSLRYLNRWQGPWAGLDLVLRVCDFTVQGGYEYHWADWRGRWKLHCPNVYGVAFSDKRKSDHVKGQVAFVDTRWNFCPCWEAGIGVKWEGWKAKKGRLHPRGIKVREDRSNYRQPCSEISSNASGSSGYRTESQNFSDVGFGKNEVDKISSAQWNAIRITLDIGCYF